MLAAEYALDPARKYLVCGWGKAVEIVLVRPSGQIMKRERLPLESFGFTLADCAAIEVRPLAEESDHVISIDVVEKDAGQHEGRP